MLSSERLRELLDYEPDTGHFQWRVSRGRVKAGAAAGRVGDKGYVIVHVDGKGYHAHRLAWMHVHGEFPPEQIDHIDGQRSNNKLANLRPATNAENLQNQRRSKSHSKSGMLGATFHNGRWRAQIVVDGKAKHLGQFDSAEQAHAAYVQAKRQFHPMGQL